MLKSVLRIIAGFITLFTFYAIHFIWTAMVEPYVLPWQHFLLRGVSMFACSIIGGYLTALIARERHWLNILWVAGLTLIYMLLNIFNIAKGETYFFMVAILLMIAGILLGGQMFIKYKLKN